MICPKCHKEMYIFNTTEDGNELIVIERCSLCGYFESKTEQRKGVNNVYFKEKNQ